MIWVWFLVFCGCCTNAAEPYAGFLSANLNVRSGFVSVAYVYFCCPESEFRSYSLLTEPCLIKCFVASGKALEEIDLIFMKHPQMLTHRDPEEARDVEDPAIGMKNVSASTIEENEYSSKSD